MNRFQVVKEKSRKTFNQQAETYDATSYSEHARSMYTYVIKKMKSYRHNSVLDVGCGTGTILSEILIEKGIHVSGIDISEEMISIAKDRIGEMADIKNGDSEQLPWNEQSFDVVLCTDSFHHYPRPEIVLSEMKRVLKPDGKIIIADLWFSSPVRQIANLILPLMKSGDVHMYSEAEIRKLTQKCGFTCIQWNKLDRNAFVVVLS